MNKLNISSELQVEKSHSNSLKIHSLESDLYKFKTEIAGYSILVQEKQDAIDLLMTEVHKLKIKLTDAAGGSNVLSQLFLM